MNLEYLQKRALSLPRKITTAMRESLRQNPTKALSYRVLVDHLALHMTRAYTLGYRQSGKSLPRASRSAKESQYRRMTKLSLGQFQKSSNVELKRVFRREIGRGRTPIQARDDVLKRFNTLGMTSPATLRMRTLYNDAMYSAFMEGIWDSTRLDPAFWGYRIVTRDDERVRHPTHTQYHGVTLPKSHKFWEKMFVPFEHG